MFLKILKKRLKSLFDFGRNLFGPTYNVLVTPEIFIVFNRKRELLSFDDFEALADYLGQQKRSFVLYLEGFDQDLGYETLPMLKLWEQRSYLRHKFALLLEKAPFVFFRRVGPDLCSVACQFPWLSSLSLVAPYLRGVRHVSLELANLYQKPTLGCLRLIPDKDFVFYASKGALCFSRCCHNDDFEELDKTMRYLERQFHVSETALDRQDWTLERLKNFFWTRRPSFALGRTGISQPNIRMPYILRVGLKIFCGLMVGLSLFGALTFFQKWEEKERRQTRLFALKQEQSQVPVQGRGQLSPLTPKILHALQERIKSQVDPLTSLKRIEPINSDLSFFRGLVWHQDSDNRLKIVFEVCPTALMKEDFQEWILQKLEPTASVFQSEIRPTEPEPVSYEDDEAAGVPRCLVVTLRSLNEGDQDRRDIFSKTVRGHNHEE